MYCKLSLRCVLGRCVDTVLCTVVMKYRGCPGYCYRGVQYKDYWAAENIPPGRRQWSRCVEKPWLESVNDSWRPLSLLLSDVILSPCNELRLCGVNLESSGFYCRQKLKQVWRELFVWPSITGFKWEKVHGSRLARHIPQCLGTEQVSRWTDILWVHHFPVFPIHESIRAISNIQISFCSHSLVNKLVCFFVCLFVIGHLKSDWILGLGRHLSF